MYVCIHQMFNVDGPPSLLCPFCFFFGLRYCVIFKHDFNNLRREALRRSAKKPSGSPLLRLIMGYMRTYASLSKQRDTEPASATYIAYGVCECALVPLDELRSISNGPTPAHIHAYILNLTVWNGRFFSRSSLVHSFRSFFFLYITTM